MISCFTIVISRDKIANLEWQRVVETPRGIRCSVPGNKNKPAVRWMVEADTAEALRRWKTICPSEQWVFPTEMLPRHRRSRAGLPMSVDKSAEKLRLYLELAGVDRPDLFHGEKGFRHLWFHDLRASNVTLARETAAPDAETAKKTKHSSKAVMDRYDHGPDEYDERFMEDLAPMHEAIPELKEIKGSKLSPQKRKK